MPYESHSTRVPYSTHPLSHKALPTPHTSVLTLRIDKENTSGYFTWDLMDGASVTVPLIFGTGLPGEHFFSEEAAQIEDPDTLMLFEYSVPDSRIPRQAFDLLQKAGVFVDPELVPELEDMA